MVTISAGRIITSIDIGTTKICVLVAQVDQDNITILGVGKHPCLGLNKGVVVDVAKTVESIKGAVKEAEAMTGMPIEYACVGISGAHVKSINSHGVVPIRRGVITQADVAHALAIARAITVPEGQQILHVLPSYFVIDGHEKVEDPLGMHGIQLEVHAHIVLGAIASVQNLIACCEKAGVIATDIVLEQIASANAVLSEDEQKLGTAIVDIGGGTSDLAVFKNGAICHTMVVSVAGNHFTSDLAIGLRMTLRDAERVKKEYGIAWIGLLKEDKQIEVEHVDGDQRKLINRSYLACILQPRAYELLAIINEELERHRLKETMITGLVLTGGGALLEGMKEIAEKIFGIPVRIGKPYIESSDPSQQLKNPIYATGYGLLLYLIKKRKKMLADNGPLVYRVMERMKSWITDFF